MIFWIASIVSEVGSFLFVFKSIPAATRLFWRCVTWRWETSWSVPRWLWTHWPSPHPPPWSIPLPHASPFPPWKCETELNLSLRRPVFFILNVLEGFPGVRPNFFEKLGPFAIHQWVLLDLGGGLSTFKAFMKSFRKIVLKSSATLPTGRGWLLRQLELALNQFHSQFNSTPQEHISPRLQPREVTTGPARIPSTHPTRRGEGGSVFVLVFEFGLGFEAILSARLAVPQGFLPTTTLRPRTHPRCSLECTHPCATSPPSQDLKTITPRPPLIPIASHPLSPIHPHSPHKFH